jgi:hypothetical protein
MQSSFGSKQIAKVTGQANPQTNGVTVIKWRV